jgi:hypothetical protein
MTYIYGLALALLYNVLLELYWGNFYKLVFAICILNQHRITTKDLCQV